MEEKERKNKVVQLFKEAKKKGRRAKKPIALPARQIIVGDGNIQAEGDIKINTREVKRFTIEPSPEHITPAQKQTIKEKIAELVEIGALAGKERESLFPHWWTALQRKFRVNSYHELNQDQYEEVLKWLSQQKAINRPKLRRRDNEAWRKEHYKAIWARTRELGKPKEWVYEITMERIGKGVTSLTELGERDLKSLYNIIMAM